MTLEDIALQMTQGIGIKGAVHLVEIFGDARSIFAASVDELVARAELRPDLAQHIVRRKAFAAAEKELAYMRRHAISAVASTDSDYPPLLRETPDYPHVLYYSGNLPALAGRLLSVVGTRQATPYGQTMCHRLIEELAARVADLAIVSGLAFGIDVAAHRAALDVGAATVAVLPNPLPGVTPAQHSGVARDLAEHGGLLLTELHGQSRQNGNFYLARNRIIAGLSPGCLLIEAPFRSGSLDTARHADGYDRTVMALPGRVTDPSSAGTNHLIFSHKAQLVRSADDIIRELGWDCGPDAALDPRKPLPESLDSAHAALLSSIAGSDPVSVERLLTESGLDPGTLAVRLLDLEVAGLITRLPGDRYLRCR